MEKQEFITKLEQAFKTEFPHGYFNTSYGVLGGETVFFTVALIGELKDCPNAIRENDPARAVFRMDKFTIDAITGTSLKCNPEPNTHYAMSSRKIGFRKATKKNYTELLTYMTKYFQKMRKFVDENKQDIFGVKDINEIYLRSPSKLEKALR